MNNSVCADTDPTNWAVVGNDSRQVLKAEARTGYATCII